MLGYVCVCVCVGTCISTASQPSGEGQCAGPLGRMVQTSQKELFELEGVAQKSPRPCAELSEESTVEF